MLSVTKKLHTSLLYAKLMKKRGGSCGLFLSILLGLICSAFVAGSAFILQWLSLSGALAAALSGTIIIALGPWFSIF